jgi:hypothetical protein
MPSSVLADLVVALHLGFILFVIFGALAALRWPRVVWLHAPAALWGAAVELFGWICPLTPLENRLRRGGATPEAEADFVERYLLPVIYPAELTRETQLIFGILVLVFNAALYTWIWRRSQRNSAD